MREPAWAFKRSVWPHLGARRSGRPPDVADATAERLPPPQRTRARVDSACRRAALPPVAGARVRHRPPCERRDDRQVRNRVHGRDECTRQLRPFAEWRVRRQVRNRSGCERGFERRLAEAGAAPEPPSRRGARPPDLADAAPSASLRRGATPRANRGRGDLIGLTSFVRPIASGPPVPPPGCPPGSGRG